MTERMSRLLARRTVAAVDEPALHGSGYYAIMFRKVARKSLRGLPVERDREISPAGSRPSSKHFSPTRSPSGNPAAFAPLPELTPSVLHSRVA